MTTKAKIEIPIITQIQNALHAPKNQYNSFGQYKYRSAEDIEQALKPLLEEYGATLYITEDVKEVGGRIYLQETIHYSDPEQQIQVSALAREADHKKGMDDSQVTGATSSYATKYALVKLFLIDDNKDTDSQKPAKQATKKSQAKHQSPLNNISDKEALNYQVQYGGGMMTIAELFKSAVHGDKQAADFLKGAGLKTQKDKMIFEVIKERKLYLD